jgi:hypothetical protein
MTSTCLPKLAQSTVHELPCFPHGNFRRVLVIPGLPFPRSAVPSTERHEQVCFHTHTMEVNWNSPGLPVFMRVQAHPRRFEISSNLSMSYSRIADRNFLFERGCGPSPKQWNMSPSRVFLKSRMSVARSHVRAKQRDLLQLSGHVQ